MSSANLEKSLAAQKASLEEMFGILGKSFEGVEKFARLNLQASKSILAENQAISAGALSAKTPQELFALQAGQAQPAVEKAQSYWRHVHEIISGSLAEITGALEMQFKRHQHDWEAFVESLPKNAPAGSEAAVSIWKSAIKTASATLESARETTRQAPQTVGSNVTAALEAPTDAGGLEAEQAEAVKKE